MERVPRIELGNKPWQGFRLPLHHTRNRVIIYQKQSLGNNLLEIIFGIFGASTQNRTGKPKRQILSLLCLPISPYSQFGPAYRNRTHIHRVEADCIIHYTNARMIGADGGTRTHKIWFLRPTRIPIPSHPQ